MQSYYQVAVIIALITACGGNTGGTAVKFKAGMVTSAGTIDDKPFNQGTLQGIVRASKDFHVDTKYLKPTGTTEADYLFRRVYR